MKNTHFLVAYWIRSYAALGEIGQHTEMHLDSPNIFIGSNPLSIINTSCSFSLMGDNFRRYSSDGEPGAFPGLTATIK